MHGWTAFSKTQKLPANSRPNSDNWQASSVSRLGKGEWTPADEYQSLPGNRARRVFSAAARQLGGPPSAIVKRINRREDQMNAQLCIRSTRLRIDGKPAPERYSRTRHVAIDDAPTAQATSAGLARGIAVQMPTTLTILNVGEISASFSRNTASSTRSPCDRPRSSTR